jgi:5-methylcytosine-specific restriction protein A
MELRIGNTYKRSELHDVYGGNRQAGITPSKDGSRIFIFSNHSGESHGYQDGWEGQYYHYTGAGQSGDQDIESNRHNGHVLHHTENNARVNLFTGATSGYWDYVANLVLVDYAFFETHDKDGKNRLAVRFTFERQGDTPPETSSKSPRPYRKPDVTSRTGLVTTRVGQGFYRQSILQKFNSVCAVLGVGPTEILIASHIVPWRESSDDERLDVDNGILLSPLLDALFDRHLISFADDGKILLGSHISEELKRRYGLKGEEKIKLTEGMRPYLERHRKELR